jgi:hypothetical protein
MYSTWRGKKKVKKKTKNKKQKNRRRKTYLAPRPESTNLHAFPPEAPRSIETRIPAEKHKRGAEEAKRATGGNNTP